MKLHFVLTNVVAGAAIGDCPILLRQWVRFFIHILTLIKTNIICQLLNWT